MIVGIAREDDGHFSAVTRIVDDALLAWRFPIVVAAPDPEIEAWRVSGFAPQDATETKILDAVCKELSFDPTAESHRSTSHPNDAPRDAKRALARLTGGDRERADLCLQDRERLRQRGEKNNAANFLDAVDKHLVPVFRRSS